MGRSDVYGRVSAICLGLELAQHCWIDWALALDRMREWRAGETIVRVDGQIAGQQFLCDEIEDCTVHVLDHCAQVRTIGWHCVYI